MDSVLSTPDAWLFLTGGQGMEQELHYVYPRKNHWWFLKVAGVSPRWALV